ncbi:undecaprenyl-phosphate 4-deoxy-4-formamido-L-arabinose transferase [Weissella oryzae SG25]|uniref:Undecaprenyl-phosphate 4-deoxy-4-formamido-L-arabinose transferase n=1 Tax=Weissella oryzae (strain DSM 25784 / JCM 18191 / LMG 30913 / SG25) TaxID=1329250 RepID=A0A069CTP5_WEIOS|nr:undecaprenyl-phosphate 4-deoxy-4-formamido-L-arabinose transferase [Weissella oryzae SG25]
MTTKSLSIIVPVYNEEVAIPIFIDAVQQNMRKMPELEVSFWFIDDGSTDKTIDILENVSHQDPLIHYIEFSRNFGKEAALYAGLQHAKGDYLAVMDVDLQDPPELLPEMLQDVMSGKWDSVGSRRTNRDGEAHLRSFFSDLFYWLINKVSDTKLVKGARDYRVMTRQMVDAILSMTEYNRFSKGIFSWVGFKTKYLEFENVDRVAGNTSWSFMSLFRYSIEGIINFSTIPLDLVIATGLVTFFASIIGIIVIIIRALIFPNTAVFGWPSLVVIILLIGSIQLLSIGVIGRYISGIYKEVKHRPIYIARRIK